MRKVVVLVLLAGCSGSKSSDGEALAPDDHALHGGIETKPDAVRARYLGKGVTVESLPGVADALGLPVAGAADVDIDVTVPVAQGERDYRRATGTIDVRCARCSIGGEGAKLKPRGSQRSKAFAGEGITFGKIVFDRLEARIELKDGRAELVHWVAESPDITLMIAGTAELARTLNQTQIHGCLRFGAKPGLEQRAPQTSAMLALTGGPRGDDGLYNVELQGPLERPKVLGKVCGEPAKP